MKRTQTALLNLAVVLTFAIVPFAGGHAGFLLGLYVFYAGSALASLGMVAIALLAVAPILPGQTAMNVCRGAGLLVLFSIWASFVGVSEYRALSFICSIPFLVLCVVSTIQLARSIQTEDAQ